MPLIGLYANLRQLAGVKEISLPGTSVGMLVHALVEQFPEMEKILLQDGQIRPHVIITVNGQTGIDLDTKVAEQDQIAIFPPIAGG